MPTVPLTGTGGLFPRIGALGQLLNDINSSRGTTIPADVTAINNQFQTTDQNIITSLYTSLSNYQSSCSSFNSPIRTIAQNTVIQMVNEVSLPPSNNSLPFALQFIINQMKTQAQTVNRCTLSSSVSYSPSNIGNPNVLISLNDINNLLVEYCFSEPGTATVTQDSQSSPNLSGVETIQLQTPFSISDTFSWLYPGGSGVSLRLNAVSGMTNGGSGTQNWLNNGSFESWSGSPLAPASWTVGTGTLGTTILRSSSPVYDGSYALQFLGNGSENTAIYQAISSAQTSGATSSLIGPNSIFGVNLWCRVSGTPGAGVIRVALSDGTNPINDNSGSPNSFTISLTSLSTTWIPFSAMFRTPNQLPVNTNLEIKMTTPITSAFSVYFDRVSFAVPTRWYPGGPYINIFSGNTPMIVGDNMTALITNHYNGQFQDLFQKLFNMTSLGLILPSSVSPTIPDSLI